MTLRLAPLLLGLVAGWLGCSRVDPPVVQPAAPLPADPPVALASMEIECDALIAALTAYKECPNLDEHEPRVIEAWIERANLDMAAGKKVEIEPNAQNQAAGACRKATDSVKAAHERCRNGPRPKQWSEPR